MNKITYIEWQISIVKDILSLVELHVEWMNEDNSTW